MPPDIPFLLAAITTGYLAGSIPFGLVLCKLTGYGDIRTIGSGSIGATNVLRTGNKPLALATLLLDSGKGALATWGFATLTDASLTVTLICGLSAILGHCFSIWLKFKGGKGVATTLGTLMAATLPVGLTTCLIWLGAAFITRISSLAALTAFTTAPIFTHLLYNNLPATLTTGLITALVFFCHRDNIKRLMSGTEPKIGKKHSDEPRPPASTAQTSSDNTKG